MNRFNIPTKSLVVLSLFFLLPLHGICQQNAPDASTDTALRALIASYSDARERIDTVLLQEILTNDIDQLVSSGTWRRGVETAKSGMVASSTNNKGKRTLTVDHIRLLDEQNGLVDCKYNIKRQDGSERRMWSTFVVVKREGNWKIAAIRNMLPAR